MPSIEDQSQIECVAILANANLTLAHNLHIQSLATYGHVEGPRPRGRPKKTWTEVVKEDSQACKLNTEDAMDRSKWRKLIKDVR